MIKTKRVYEPFEKTDGYRILVDRLWPRGVSKEKAQLNLWLKEIAPTTELRIWFNHDPKKWDEFIKKYKMELKSNKDLIKQIKELEKKHKTITLLYAARDETHNEALIIQKMLK